MSLETDFPGIVIAGDSCRITLSRTDEPLDYGIPTQIDVFAGPFSGTFQDKLFYGLSAFIEQIEALHERLHGEAELRSLEGHLNLLLHADKLGHVAVRCKTIAQHFPPIVLEFEFSIDQSYLPQIARDARRYFLTTNDV